MHPNSETRKQRNCLKPVLEIIKKHSKIEMKWGNSGEVREGGGGVAAFN